MSQTRTRIERMRVHTFALSNASTTSAKEVSCADTRRNADTRYVTESANRIAAVVARQDGLLWDTRVGALYATTQWRGARWSFAKPLDLRVGNCIRSPGGPVT